MAITARPRRRHRASSWYHCRQICPEPILTDNFRAIDADSSPIRYRACFDTTLSLAMLSETYVVSDEIEPRNAPRLV